MTLSVILSLLVVLVIFFVIYWAVHKLAGAFGAPAPVIVVFDVLLVVAFVLYALQVVGLLARIR